MENDKITALVRELCSKLGAVVDDVTVSEEAGHVLFTVHTKDSGVLIGSRGDTLSALNHVVKKALEKQGVPDESLRFTVDVNGYHLKHMKMLEGQAKILAERARTFKYDVEMSPMTAYDRMIVHAALSGAPNVRTESSGEGRMRHVTIKYVEETPAP